MKRGQDVDTLPYPADHLPRRDRVIGCDPFSDGLQIGKSFRRKLNPPRQVRARPFPQESARLGTRKRTVDLLPLPIVIADLGSAGVVQLVVARRKRYVLHELYIAFL
jgi:hypothetical protein